MIASPLTRSVRRAFRSVATPRGPSGSMVGRSVVWGALASLFMAAPGWAIDVVVIEEHWELRIGAPDAESSAPQVSMVMAPFNHLNDTYFIYTLNHRTNPTFTAGGMQVQRWSGENLVSSQTGNDTSPLTHTQEVVSWVQRLELNGDQLRFEVDSGTSQSWGEFGGGGNLRVVAPTDMVNLNTYRPQISLTQSGVSFAGNRVHSLTLTKLRWIDSEGEEYEMEAPIDVDADLDP